MMRVAIVGLGSVGRGVAEMLAKKDLGIIVTGIADSKSGKIDNKGIDLETSGGNLVVKLPKSISAEVSAQTTGGDVNCDFQFSGKLREGNLQGKINGGGNLIKLETSGGDIVISSVE